MLPKSKLIQVSYQNIQLIQKAVEFYLTSDTTEVENQNANHLLYEIDHILDAWGDKDICNAPLVN
jgi:hypothetical protein